MKVKIVISNNPALIFGGLVILTIDGRRASLTSGTDMTHERALKIAAGYAADYPGADVEIVDNWQEGIGND